MYFDGLDTEYCLRVLKHNYLIMECSEAVLNHHPAITRELKIGNKVIFRYGIDSPVRYYYQFRSGYYLHKKFGDVKNDLFMLYKYLKVVFLFNNKAEYKRLIKLGIQDAKLGYYGKYEEQRYERAYTARKHR
jgi:rhamnosyltransferase